MPKKSPVISQYFIGISLYDPDSQEELISVNSTKYFTPASNTKILTLATWLDTGLDSIPSFTYYKKNNTLYIRPLGDPTFLHPDFPLQDAYYFLLDQSYDSLVVISPPEAILPFGSGWAWDDYTYEYQPERSFFPMYGNTVHTFINDQKVEYVPDFFNPYIETKTDRFYRSPDFNYFELPVNKYLGTSTELIIPFRQTNELIARLLADTLSKPVEIVDSGYRRADEKIIFGYDRLPVLAQMMLRSDNFLAEQLLLNAQMHMDVSNSEVYLSQTKNSLFASLDQVPEWVDGSGLSRYNMFTPRSLTQVLEVIYRQLSWREINLIFPKGGVSGTIKNWYGAETPYIFAKTGTLRHNHCLSGYLVAKSGKRLIFSFMNNHYTNGTTEVKEEMQRILEAIRDAY
ncbi:MAG: D-alanyl-D-alanine carboxypeptidase/D-alanyl-D-alanine-endopeptidase (penicillin-binding protein 4) [Cyclobacteriaceae bacterium]